MTITSTPTGPTRRAAATRRVGPHRPRHSTELFPEALVDSAAMWLPWPYAVVGAVMLATAAVLIRPKGRVWTEARPFALEISLILVLYALWRIAGQLSVLHTDGAEARGRDIWNVEQTLHLPSELAVQRAVLPHPWLVQAANVYYAVVHVPALIAMLIWLFVRHRDRYPAVRNTLALLTGACLLVQLVPVMPPRLMSSLGFVDTGHLYGQSVYTALGRGASDQLSAMPSLHVGWALLVGIVVVVASTSRWRWIVLAHPALTISVVVVTANHWWMDGIVAALILVASYGVDRSIRRQLALRRAVSPAPETARAAPTGAPTQEVVT